MMLLKRCLFIQIFIFFTIAVSNVNANDKTLSYTQINNILNESKISTEIKLNNSIITYNAYQINKKYEHSIRDNTFDPNARKIKRVDMQATEYIFNNLHYRIDRDVVTQSSLSSDRNDLINGTDGTMTLHRRVGHILTPTIEAKYNEIIDFEVKINPSWTIEPRSDRKIGHTISPSAINCLYSFFMENDNRYIFTFIDNAYKNENMYFNTYFVDNQYKIEVMENNKVMPRPVKRLSFSVQVDSPENVLQYITYDNYEYIIEYINIDYDDNKPIHISHYKCYDKTRSSNPDDIYEASGVIFEIDIIDINNNEILNDDLFDINNVIVINDRVYDQINGKSYIFDGTNNQEIRQ